MYRINPILAYNECIIGGPKCCLYVYLYLSYQNLLNDILLYLVLGVHQVVQKTTFLKQLKMVKMNGPTNLNETIRVSIQQRFR
jgi:hypothetical protein